MLSKWNPRPSRSAALVVLACGALLPGASMAAAQAPTAGPYRVPEQNPMYGLFLTPRPERADVLRRGQVELAWRTRYSNVFEYVREADAEATFDHERWSNIVDLSWAPVDRLELGVRVGAIAGFGGILDGLVQWYHQRLNLPNGDREDVENGDFEMTLVRGGDTLLSMPSGASVIDPVIWAAVPLIQSDRGALALRVSSRIPIGTDDFSSGRADVAAQLDGRRSGESWTFHAGVAAGTLRAPPNLEPFTRSLALSWHLGAARRLGDGWGAMAQLQGSSAYFSDLGSSELTSAPINLGVGLVGTAGERWSWQAAFTEDVRPNSPAVDFTIDLHLSRVVGPTR